jgi:hypothetical protein
MRGDLGSLGLGMEQGELQGAAASAQAAKTGAVRFPAFPSNERRQGDKPVKVEQETIKPGKGRE